MEDELGQCQGELFSLAERIARTAAHIDGLRSSSDRSTTSGDDSRSNCVHSATGTTHRISMDCVYEDTIRLMHVYVFPRIVYTRDYEMSVKKAMEQIENEEANLGVLVKGQIASKELLKEAVRSARMKILQSNDLRNSKTMSSLDDHFLEVLMKHVVKEIDTVGREIQGFENKISPLRGSTDEVDVQRLSELRTARDNSKCLTTYNMLLTKREEIKECIDFKTKAKHKSNQPDRTSKLQRKGSKMHTDYEKMSEQLDRFETTIRELMDTKLKVSSVREAAKQALRHIVERGDLRINSNTIPTLVKRREKKQTLPDEWKTLKDHVTGLISGHEGECRSEFLVYLDEIQELCMELNAQTFKRERAASTDMCRSTCAYVKAHMDRMTRRLQDCIPDDPVVRSQPLAKRLFLCYERHAFEVIMPVLSKLYETSYKQWCEDITNPQHSGSGELVAIPQPSCSGELKNGHINFNTTTAGDKFQEFIVELQSSQSLVQKMKLITAILKLVSTDFRNSRVDGSEFCADDCLDGLVTWIRRLDRKLLLVFYSQLMLVVDLCPASIRQAQHDYSLTTLTVAFRHITNASRP